jgi:hypothetical protein
MGIFDVPVFPQPVIDEINGALERDFWELFHLEFPSLTKRKLPKFPRYSMGRFRRAEWRGFPRKAAERARGHDLL